MTTKIYVTFHHADYGLCQETFQEVFRIVDNKIFPEMKKYFNRDTKSGEWYTVYPSRGYWENSSLVKEEIEFAIVNKKGNVIYFDDSKDYVSVDKKIKEMEEEFRKKYNFVDYYEWKKFLTNTSEFKEYKGYSDNYLFCNSEIVKGTEEKLESFNYLDNTYILKKELYVHKLCNKKYAEYFIYSPQTEVTITIGYELIEQ
ncbi:MAG: hypothetical protein K0R54_1824 [Clostridiaceae bacterium]|jgi:hypothetical protein|nr:hypothetical protein [Clostridiaceae bacterium]